MTLVGVYVDAANEGRLNVSRLFAFYPCRQASCVVPASFLTTVSPPSNELIRTSFKKSLGPLFGVTENRQGRESAFEVLATTSTHQ